MLMAPWTRRSLLRRSAALATAIVAYRSFHYPVLAQEFSPTPYRLGMDYGVGFNSLTGEQLGDAVVRTDPIAVEGATGQTVTFSLRKIETQEDIQKALGVSVGAEASYGGLFGGSTRVTFVEEQKFHSYSVFLMVRTTVFNSFRQMRDVQLKSEALELLKQCQMRPFRNRYGDKFVQGMMVGGEFFAVLEIRTKSSDEFKKTTVDVEANLSAGVFGAEAAVEVAKSLKKITEGKSTNILIFQVGGSETEVPVSLDNLMERAISFPDLVSGDKGVPFAATLVDYRSLDPGGCTWFELKTAEQTLRHLGGLYANLSGKLNNIDYLLSHRDEFVSDTTDWQAHREELVSALGTLRDAAITCSQSAEQCEEPSLVTPQIPSLPNRIDGPQFEPNPDPLAGGQQCLVEAGCTAPVAPSSVVYQLAPEAKEDMCSPDFMKYSPLCTTPTPSPLDEFGPLIDFG